MFHGGDLSAEVACELQNHGVMLGHDVQLRTLDSFWSWAHERRLGNEGGQAVAALLVTTVEDEQPDESAAKCLDSTVRTWKTGGASAASTLIGLRFSVLGLGDSRAIGASYRTTTWATARDCNQAGCILCRCAPCHPPCLPSYAAQAVSPLLRRLALIFHIPKASSCVVVCAGGAVDGQMAASVRWRALPSVGRSRRSHGQRRC